MANNDEKSFYNVSDKMLRAFNEGGCQIKTIECNQEFQSIMDLVADNLGVDMNHTNAQDYIAAAERNNCTLKENTQTTCQRSGHTTIPKQMTTALAEHNMDQLNMFPAKHGTSPHHGPKTIVTGEQLITMNIASMNLGHVNKLAMNQKRRTV